MSVDSVFASVVSLIKDVLNMSKDTQELKAINTVQLILIIIIILKFSAINDYKYICTFELWYSYKWFKE